jgi:hypothetical protein
MKIAYDVVGALLASLAPERRRAITEITGFLLDLRLSPEASDAIIAAIILEATEAQLIEDGGAVPPVRDSTLDLLRPIFESKKTKTKIEN